MECEGLVDKVVGVGLAREGVREEGYQLGKQVDCVTLAVEIVVQVGLNVGECYIVNALLEIVAIAHTHQTLHNS